jgi:ethanolamine ammonia-lyase small subunit
MNLSTQPSPWQALRRFTPARIALGRAGGSVPTAALLEFRLAHARARDALTRPLDQERLVTALEASANNRVLCLHTAARDFDEYLLRPDLGRRLDAPSADKLHENAGAAPDLVMVVSEGLSTLAVETHAADVVQKLFPLLVNDGWSIAPTCLVRLARVAVQDHIGEIVRAKLALILLGERPGLVSPDSLGAYLVYGPRVGNTDAQRNCVSNISAHGLTPEQAAMKLHWLLTQSRTRAISGVNLKDEFNPSRQLPGPRA